MNVGRRGLRLAVTIAGVAGVAVILALALAGGPRWPAGGPARAATGQCGTSDNLFEVPTAVVTLTPDLGLAGTSLAVGLTGFAVNPVEEQPVEVLWNWDPDIGEGWLMGSGTIPPEQTSIMVTAVVPEYAEGGAWWVTACWYRPASDTWFYRKATFEVVEPSPTPSPTPTPTATPTATASPTPSATPLPVVEQMRNCPQAGKWAIAVWEGDDDTATGEALAACGEGVVEAAYYLDPASQMWSRWFLGHPDLSNLERVNKLLGVIVRGRVVPIPSPSPLPTPTPPHTPTATPSPTPPPVVEQMRNCPQSGKWAIAVWDGADDTDVGEAVNTCEEGEQAVDYAYDIDPESQKWLRWFAGLPEISSLLTLKDKQGLVAHGKATLPAPAGRIALVSNRDNNDLEIYAVNSDGTGLTNLTQSPGADDSPAWSPDGSKLAFMSYRDGNPEIYVMNADGTGQTRLTTDPADDEQPVWSPDGSKIAFVSEREGSWGIWVMNADGSAPTKVAWGGGVDDPAWSPDGSKIAFSSWSDVSIVNADGTGVVTNLTNIGSSLWALEPVWAPDGSKIAYRCCDDDDWEIYVMNADGTAQTNLTNSPGWDSGHAWSPDGTQIAFNSSRDGNDEIYVMKPDGTSPTRLTNTGSDSEHNPSWSPDSSRLAVECTISTNAEVCVVDAQGETDISNHPWVDDAPAWSP